MKQKNENSLGTMDGVYQRFLISIPFEHFYFIKQRIVFSSLAVSEVFASIKYNLGRF
jgi:hypothetical protein